MKKYTVRLADDTVEPSVTIHLTGKAPKILSVRS
jgi:hypothetical protein